MSRQTPITSPSSRRYYRTRGDPYPSSSSPMQNGPRFRGLLADEPATAPRRQAQQSDTPRPANNSNSRQYPRDYRETRYPHRDGFRAPGPPVRYYPPLKREDDTVRNHPSCPARNVGGAVGNPASGSRSGGMRSTERDQRERPAGGAERCEDRLRVANEDCKCKGAAAAAVPSKPHSSTPANFSRLSNDKKKPTTTPYSNPSPAHESPQTQYTQIHIPPPVTTIDSGTRVQCIGVYTGTTESNVQKWRIFHESSLKALPKKEERDIEERRAQILQWHGIRELSPEKKSIVELWVAHCVLERDNENKRLKKREELMMLAGGGGMVRMGMGDNDDEENAEQEEEGKEEGGDEEEQEQEEKEPEEPESREC